MASPQKENGYVPIANEIVEALARIRISGEAMQVLWVVLRKTYGFNKKEDYIALSQFVLATGLKKPTVCKAINRLVSLGVVTQKDNGEGKTYMFIKDFEHWSPLPKKITLPKKVIGVTKKGNNRYPKRVLQKTKDTITKDISAPEAVAFNYENELNKLLNADREDLRIIGIWMQERRFKPENHVQIQSMIRRFLRAAKNLCGYDPKDIRYTIAALRQIDYLKKFTLETVAKYIDEMMEKSKKAGPKILRWEFVAGVMRPIYDK